MPTYHGYKKKNNAKVIVSILLNEDSDKNYIIKIGHKKTRVATDDSKWSVELEGSEHLIRTHKISPSKVEITLRKDKSAEMKLLPSPPAAGPQPIYSHFLETITEETEDEYEPTEFVWPEYGTEKSACICANDG